MVSRSIVVDYYKELGINRHATSVDIRTAYKRLALIWHPDRNKAKDAEEKFKRIKQAHDILIDQNRKREYDQQQRQQTVTSQKKQRQKDKSFETKTTKDYTQAERDQFNLHTFDHFTCTPIDPFDILNDIQAFQESDFTSKMLDSPSYRKFYTRIFNSMNNNTQYNDHIHSLSPIYLNNNHLFRLIPKTSSKHHSTPILSKDSLFNSNSVIHSTTINDWFLNELIDLHEQENFSSMQSLYSPIINDSFFNDLIHNTISHKKISNDRNHLIQHEQQTNNQYKTIPTKTVRV